MKKSKIVTVSAILVLPIAACSKPQEQPARGSQIGKEPATVTIFSDNGTLHDEFRDKIIETVRSKYPHITPQFIQGKNLEEYMAAQETPDMIYTYWTNMGSYKNKDLLEDMTPLLRKYQFDLSRIDPKYLDDVRKLSDKGELYAIPCYTNFQALYYNKDIFTSSASLIRRTA